MIVLLMWCIPHIYSMQEKALTRNELIEELYRAHENRTPTPPLSRSLEEISKEAMKVGDEELFYHSAQHLSPRTLDKISFECVELIPQEMLKDREGISSQLIRMLGRIAEFRQKDQ